MNRYFHSLVIQISTTIAISKKTCPKLYKLKMKTRVKDFNVLISLLIKEYRKLRFLEASMLFKKRLSNMNLTLEDLLGELCFRNFNRL